MDAPNAPTLLRRTVLLPMAGGMLALVGWAYWSVLAGLANKWESDPQYSHGYLVPLFSLVLLWLRRAHLADVRVGVYPFGLALIAAGGLAHALGGVFNFDTLSAFALLPTLAGVAALFGGWPALRWCWPAVLFLGFMFPLPYRVEVALSVPLRSLATTASVWLLQAFGRPAVAEGNVILLEHGKVAVAEACSGLSMFLTFFALTAAVLILARRPWTDAVAVVLSAPVIAVVTNVLRIVANGLAVDIWGPETAQKWVHDQAGWAMMPVGVGLLFLELWLIDKMWPAEPDAPRTQFAASMLGPVGRPPAPPTKARVAVRHG
ncbi:MAG: exosortase/archaeosortase family protein [Gemmataceae bacterium]